MDIDAAYIFDAVTKPFVKGMKIAGAALSDFLKTNTTAGIGAGNTGAKLKNEGDSAERATSSLGRMALALSSLNAMQLSDVRDEVSGIVDSLGNSSGNFTSSIGNMAKDFDKGFAGMAAKAGLYGSALRKEESKIFKAAYALNADAGQLGENFLSLKKQGITAEDLGLSGLEDLTRVLDVTGLSGEQLAGVFTNLSRSYGFTKEQAQGFLNTFTQQTTALGIGTEAFGSLDDIFKSLDQKFATTLASEGPEAVQKTISSMIALSSAMTKAVGGTPQDNLQSTIQLFEKLQDESNVLPQMMSGLDAEFGSLANTLGVALPGGFNEAMDAIKNGATDPLSFAKNMSKMYAEIKEKGGPQANVLLQQMSKLISDELGPSFEYLFESGGTAVAVIESMQKPVKGGIKTLSELGKQGYRTGLSLDDSLSRIKDGFEATFKGLAMKDASRFVATQGKSYKMLGKALKTLAEGKGLPMLTEQMLKLGLSEKKVSEVNDTLSKLTRSASLFESGGLAAALQPFIGDTGPLGAIVDGFAQVATGAVPVLTMFGALGFNFGSLMKPLKLLVWPLEMVFAGLSALAGPEVAAVVGVVGAIVGSVYLFSKALDGTLGPAVQGMTKTVVPYIEMAGDKISSFFDGILASVTSIDADAIANSITTTFDSMMNAVEGWLNSSDGTSSPLLKFWTNILGKEFDIASVLIPKLKAVADKIPWDKMFERGGALLSLGLSKIADIVLDGMGAIADYAIARMSTKEFWGGVWNALVWGITTVVKTNYRALTMPFSFLFGFLESWIPYSLGNIRKGLTVAFDKVWSGLVDTAKAWGPTILKSISVLFGGFSISNIVFFVGKASSLLGGFFKEGGTFSVLLGQAKAFVESTFDAIALRFSEFGEKAAKAFSFVKDSLGFAFKLMFPMATAAFTILSGYFDGFGGKAISVFTTIKDSLFSAFTEMSLYLGDTFDWIEKTLTNSLSNAALTVSSVFETIGTTIQSAWDKIIGFFLVAWDKVADSFTSAKGAISSIGSLLGLTSDTNAPVTQASSTQVADAKKVVESSDIQLYAKADTRSLMEVMRREGEKTRIVLGEIRDRIPVVGPVTSARAAFPSAGSGISATRPR